MNRKEHDEERALMAELAAAAKDRDPELDPKDGDHIIGVHFLNFKAGNMLATTWLRDGEARGCVRLRIFMDDKVWGSNDVRKFWTISGKDKPLSEAEIQSKVALMFSEAYKNLKAAGTSDGELHLEFIPINGGMEDMIREISKKDFISIKTIEVGEA